MRTLSILLAALASVPVAAQDPPMDPNGTSLSLEQQTGLRCAAAFALTARQQADGDADALRYPPLAERGREFMVQFSAHLMDDADLTREQIATLLMDEAQTLYAERSIDDVMPACLLLLGASGL